MFKDYDQMDVVPDVRAALAGAPDEYRAKVEQVLEHHSKHHLQALTLPVGHLFVPIFFVYTGMQVDLATLANVHALLVALAVTALAFVGKLLSGLAAGAANKWIIGWGMAPRGEVGLIFAMVGKQLGVVDDEVFSVVVIMVMLTTLLTPMILSTLIRRQRSEAPAD
jgi:Kef-type K+ transport system membrane component KefB